MITAERARELLDAYGGNAANWPSEEREGLQAFIDHNPEAQAWLREAVELDGLLSSYQPVVTDISEQILNAVPLSSLERFLQWLLPHSLGDCWRPATAAAIPLALGIAIGATGVTGSAGVADGAGDWQVTEAALLASESTGSWYE